VGDAIKRGINEPTRREEHEEQRLTAISLNMKEIRVAKVDPWVTKCSKKYTRKVEKVGGTKSNNNKRVRPWGKDKHCN